MELPQSFIDKDVEAMFMAAEKRRQDRQQAIQRQLAQQQMLLDQERVAKTAEINEAVKELPQDALKYPALLHDIERERALAEADYMRKAAGLRVYGMPAGQSAQEINRVNKFIEERFGSKLKEFEDTEQFKVGKENWAKLQKNAESLGFLQGELKKGQELLLAGQNIAANNLFKQSVMKGINSIISPDAVQVGEMLIRYPQLLRASDVNMLKSNSIFTSAGPFVAKFLEQKEPILEEDKNKLIEALGNIPPEERKKGLQQIFDKANSVDPWTFYDIATRTFNGAVSGYNDSVQRQVFETTSPMIGKRLGAQIFQPLETVGDLRQKAEQKIANQPARSTTFGQTTIQGGAGQMPATVPQQAPAQQPAKPKMRLISIE